MRLRGWRKKHSERESTRKTKDAIFEKGKIDIANLKQAEDYNKSAHSLQQLSAGETVRVKTPNRPMEKEL